MWIHVCSKKKYNEGEDFGEMIYLPIEPSKIEEIIKKYSYNYQHDIAIHDYELPFEISEYENLNKVNELCKFIVENNIDPSKLSHIEHDQGENVIDISKEELLKYISVVNVIHADNKKEFCLKYYEDTERNLIIPEELSNAINCNLAIWEHVFSQLEISLCITQDKENAKFYYTHI